MEAVGMLGWQDSTVANLMGKAVEERHSDWCWKDETGTFGQGSDTLTLLVNGIWLFLNRIDHRLVPRKIILGIFFNRLIFGIKIIQEYSESLDDYSKTLSWFQ